MKYEPSRMTDEIALRWQIDDATAKFATGKAESGVYQMGGFKWTAALKRRVVAMGNERSEFTLRCENEDNHGWNCEANISTWILKSDGSWVDDVDETRFWFHEKASSWFMDSSVFWNSFSHAWYKINDRVTVEFRINIIKSECGVPVADLIDFTAPNTRSDVILKIDEKKLYVSKENLSLNSPVFETLFFGNFDENGKEEVKIEVDYEEFVDLLNLIYPGTVEITDHTVQHILKLADQFQMKGVMAQAEKHLTHSNNFDQMTKLMTADKYRLARLKEHCLNSFTTVNDLSEKMQSFPEYANFSVAMKVALLDRIVQMKP